MPGTDSRETGRGDGRDFFTQMQSTEDGQRLSWAVLEGRVRPEWPGWKDDSDGLNYLHFQRHLAEDKYFTWSFKGGWEEAVRDIFWKEMTVNEALQSTF